MCRASFLTRGLSASHLNPTVDSVAARSSAAGQHRPGQHSAPARSGEIRQSPTYAAGILSQTRGDRRREIFWRVATRGPERDSSLRRRGRDGDSSFGVNSSAAKGERGKNTLGFFARRSVVCGRHWGQTPRSRQATPSLQREFCSDGVGRSRRGRSWRSAARSALC